MAASFDEVLDWLKAAADPVHRDGLARYGIPTQDALGVPMGEIKKAARRFGRSHEIIFDLWDTQFYEARVMAIHLAEPTRLTREAADSWCLDFSNWALCDTACFHLFDRTTFRWHAARDWSADHKEYVRRAGFATLWGLSVHDKAEEDRSFIQALEWARVAAVDDRVAVRKAVDMAVRAIGKRNVALNSAALALAAELSKDDGKSAAWLGRHIQKELTSDRVQKRLGLR